MNKIFISIIILGSFFKINGQNRTFPKEPLSAQFVTSDIENFWIAFDSVEKSKNNPFDSYLINGTVGLKGFIENRIINADSLLNMVKRRNKDYRHKHRTIIKHGNGNSRNYYADKKKKYK